MSLWRSVGKRSLSSRTTLPSLSQPLQAGAGGLDLDPLKPSVEPVEVVRGGVGVAPSFTASLNSR